jgi:integrase
MIRYYCDLFGEVTSDNCPTFEKLQLFCKALVEKRPPIKAATIGLYLGALKTEMEIKCCKCLQDDESRLLKRLIEGGVKRRDALSGVDSGIVKRAEIIPEDVIKKLADLSLIPGSPKDQVRSATILGVVFVMRFGDVLNIKRSDIVISYTKGELSAIVKTFSTKTKPVEERQTACVAGSGKVCVKMFCSAHYLKSRKEETGLASGKLFPLLTKDNFMHKLKELARVELPGVDVSAVANLTNHSLRRTGASRLIDLGVPAEEVKAAGHWESAVWQTYAESGIRHRSRLHSSLILE